MTEPFAHDRFLVDQLVRPMVNLYRIAAPAAEMRALGGPIAFVRQKRLALKEDIRFFADDSESQELFRIKARSMIEIGGRYDFLIDGSVVGRMDRKLKLRDRYVLDLSGDAERRIDRRLGLALAIGLDALQNR